MRDPAISSARQTLTIGTADLEAARLLQVPLNSPVAEVRGFSRPPIEPLFIRRSHLSRRFHSASHDLRA